MIYTIRTHFVCVQVLKGVKVSLACDVFSYGMVLFELFKHEMPFAGIHDLKVSNMIIDGKVCDRIIHSWYAISESLHMVHVAIYT